MKTPQHTTAMLRDQSTLPETRGGQATSQDERISYLEMEARPVSSKRLHSPPDTSTEIKCHMTLLSTFTNLLVGILEPGWLLRVTSPPC